MQTRAEEIGIVRCQPTPSRLSSSLISVHLSADSRTGVRGNDGEPGTAGIGYGVGSADLVLRDNTTGVTWIDEFNNSGALVAQPSLTNANGTAFAVTSQTSVLAVGRNALGQGGADLTLRDAAGNVTVDEFSTSGILVASGPVPTTTLMAAAAKVAAPIMLTALSGSTGAPVVKIDGHAVGSVAPSNASPISSTHTTQLVHAMARFGTASGAMVDDIPNHHAPPEPWLAASNGRIHAAAW